MLLSAIADEKTMLKFFLFGYRPGITEVLVSQGRTCYRVVTTVEEQVRSREKTRKVTSKRPKRRTTEDGAGTSVTVLPFQPQ
jgi:hypothetical protein